MGSIFLSEVTNVGKNFSVNLKHLIKISNVCHLKVKTPLSFFYPFIKFFMGNMCSFKYTSSIQQHCIDSYIQAAYSSTAKIVIYKQHSAVLHRQLYTSSIQQHCKDSYTQAANSSTAQIVIYKQQTAALHKQLYTSSIQQHCIDSYIQAAFNSTAYIVIYKQHLAVLHRQLYTSCIQQHCIHSYL